MSGDAQRISFRVRPVTVRGELRISWRLAVVVLMLAGCRKQRSSLIKLHILNDAVRSDDNAELLRRVLREELAPSFWRTRVEPAFGRAVDLAVGSGLVSWVHNIGRWPRTDAKGNRCRNCDRQSCRHLENEKKTLEELGSKLTEQRAGALTSPRMVARA